MYAIRCQFCFCRQQALLDELEFSLPFRENAFRHLRQTFPDARIEDILGVTAAKKDPALVLKVTAVHMNLVSRLVGVQPIPRGRSERSPHRIKTNIRNRDKTNQTDPPGPKHPHLKR